MAMFYKTRNNAIKFYDDYSTMISKAKDEPTKGKELEILTPKQIIERLSVPPAQVKAVNNSENLLNEIRQVVY